MDEETALVGENSSPTPTLNHQRDVHILCWAFLLIFLAYGAVQNLETTINTEGDLGTISLGILYLSFAVFSVIASFVVRKLGSKNAVVLGSTGYWLFIAANLKPTWLVGNLITLALLRDEKGGTTGGTTLLFVMFLCSSTLGTILMCFMSKRNSKEEELKDSSATLSSSVLSLLKTILALFLDVRILLVIPLLAYSGLQQAFVWAEYTKFLIKPAIGERGVGGAMAVYGVFDAICSVAAGRLTSGLPSITIIVSLEAIIQATVLFLLLNYSVSQGLVSTLFLLLLGGMWGIGNGVLNTQLSALLGILFKHDLEGAFAQLKLWQSISIAVVYFLSAYISFRAMVLIMITALCISVVGFLFLTLKMLKAFSRHAS